MFVALGAPTAATGETLRRVRVPSLYVLPGPYPRARGFRLPGHPNALPTHEKAPMPVLRGQAYGLER